MKELENISLCLVVICSSHPLEPYLIYSSLSRFLQVVSYLPQESSTTTLLAR